MLSCILWQQRTLHKHAFVLRHRLIANAGAPCPRQLRRCLTARSATDRPGELALRKKLVSKLSVGSEAGREEVWGFYRRITSEDMSWDTISQVLHLVAKDSDSTRALTRISLVLEELVKRRSLLKNEIDDVQKLCAQLEDPTAARLNKALAQHAVEKPVSDAKDASGHGPIQVKPGRSALLEGVLGGPLTFLPEKLDSLLEHEAITLDPKAVWGAYRSAIEAGSLSDAYAFKKVIRYCSSLGYISGRRFLTQIESDLTSKYPDLLIELRPAFVLEYAKLGSLDGAQRFYQMAGPDELQDSLDWSLCMALFWSHCQKKGRALFDTRFVARNLATANMFTMILHEYAMMRNSPAVYSLFDTMKRIGIEPSGRAVDALAQACATDADIERGTRRLADVVAFVRSWGLSLGITFITGLLRGYEASRQDEMFDAVASRVDVDAIGADNIRAYSVIMRSAVRRGNIELVRDIARRIAADDRRGALQAVEALCAIGDIDAAKAICGEGDARRFPINNLTANMLLEISLSDASTDPRQLAADATRMVSDGFTPSLRLFSQLVNTLWFRGGANLALSAYENLLAAGVPASVGLLLKVVQLRLRSSNRRLALDAFETACDRLRSIDVGRLYLDDKSMLGLMELLIDQKGIYAALRAFEFLQGLPINQSSLPYGLMIEHLINSSLFDRAHSLIRKVVQNDICVSSQGAKVSSRYFLLTSTVSDAVNFLRYLHRTDSLWNVDVATVDSVLLRCVEARRMADFKWICEVMAKYKLIVPVWVRAVDRFAPSNGYVLLEMVRAILLNVDRKSAAAVTLLRSCTRSPYRAMAAVVILRVVSEDGMVLSSMVAKRAFSHILGTWTIIKRGRSQSKLSLPTLSYLSDVLYRNMAPAINAGIGPSLLTRALRVVSSIRPDAYEDCLALLRKYPRRQLSISFFGAIATGCSESGIRSTKGIDAVLKESLELNVKPTANLFVSIMQAYCSLPPPAKVNPDASQEAPGGSHQSPSGGLHHHDAIDKEMLPLQGSAPSQWESPQLSLATNDRMKPRAFSSEDYSTDPVIQFHRRTLGRLLLVLEELWYYELVVPRAAYTLIIQTCIRSHEFRKGESLIRDMANSKTEHDYVSILQVILLYLRWNKPEQAFAIFDSMGNPKKCKRFSTLYLGLEKLEQKSEHFSIIIDYYLQNGLLNNAAALLQVMHNRDIRAEVWVYTKAFKLFADADMKPEFVGTMRQVSRLGVKVDQDMLSVIKEYIAAHSNKDSKPEN